MLQRRNADGADAMERGPSLRAVVVMAIGALALIATSPAPPRLEGYVIGSVVLGGGESTERELRIHVEPGGGGASRGSIEPAFQAASGLQPGYTEDASIEFAGAADADGTFMPSANFPLERCPEGCDLVYRLRITTGPSVLPMSVIRYRVDVQLEYDSGYYERDASQLRLELDGGTTGPPAPLWSILAGVLALIAGVAFGPAIHRALGPRRRSWPAAGLIAMGLLVIGWMVARGWLFAGRLMTEGRISLSPDLLLAIVDPWSVALLATLVWGIWLGLRRQSSDGGWVLGLAAVAAVGLGGLWFAWATTVDVVIQPVALAIPFVLLGFGGGTVIAGAWRRGPTGDRWWGTFAVLSHGIVIAGFGFQSLQSYYDPFSQDPGSFLLLIPMVLVTLAFRRWLSGRQRWLILFDLLVAAVGLLGLWFTSTSFGGTSSYEPFEIDDLAILVAVIASLVAMITSFHRMRATPADPPARGFGGDPATTAPAAPAT